MQVSAPGRVNLIGEHIDYHGLPVLPIALRRCVRVRFERNAGATIRARSVGFGARQFEWTRDLRPVARGDWENYIRAAALAAGAPANGIDAAIESDIPPAAGLSSSSALIVAFTLALLRANSRELSFEQLMEILPDAEQFVGTRGGGMDHAASLASRAGYASLIAFRPLSVTHIPVPPDWSFLVAHSLQLAEKSGPARENYNARRKAGTTALERLGLEDYASAIETHATAEALPTEEERDAFLHVTTEALRVQAAATAMRSADAAAFGQLLVESHASLRHRLLVSTPTLDRLVDAAMRSGALGARLTGAGFGGCAVVFCLRSQREAVRDGLMRRFYAGREEFRAADHLIDAEPGPGALQREMT